jgi:A/G-specific adenine glycosylase
VLRLWEGLGYYRRARDLHRAARQVVAEYGGRLPDDPDVWRRLPGIGRYTLGAVLSQAFDRRLPILEANSRRVLCRLFGRTDDPRRGPGLRWLWQTAEELLPTRRAGDFNQALMELGALVCTPAADCPRCPLARECVARRLGLQAQIPAPERPPEVVEVREVAVAVRRGNRLLLVQRPGHGRWAGMWEFPHGEAAGPRTGKAAAARLLEELTGIRAELTAELMTVRHTVTRHRIHLRCFRGGYRGGRFRSPIYVQARWVEPSRLPDYPFSVPQRRLAQALLDRIRAE